MKIDLKILLIVLAVVLIVGFLEADPAMRSRSRSGGRRSSSSSRRRGSSVSRRRRNTSSSSSGSVDIDTPVITVVVIVVNVLVFILILMCVCYCYRRRRQSQDISDSWFTREMDNRGYRGPEGFGNTPTKDDEEEEQDNEVNAAQNPAFENGGDAALILPYPPGDSDQNAAYPQSSSSLPYPPQEGIGGDPPSEENAPLYPPQSSSSAYPPQGMGEEMSDVSPRGWQEETQEGSKVFAPPLQLENGDDLPPPPSYEDIEEKKKM